jgi:serine/threonine-protein kinase
VLAGRFELQRRLGEGTFAEVWLATDRQAAPPAEVALKIFRPLDDHVSPDWTPVLREVAAVAKIDPHPNLLLSRAVLKVVFFGTVTTPCLLMDYVRGDNLALWLARLDPPSPAGLPHRLTVMGDLLRGIAHAHASGVVHHDVSFGNVLVRDSDPPRALLTDFGSSLAEEPDSLPAPDDDGTALQPIYPPPYSCLPTLAEGARRDLYAFATLCYLTLSGRHPLSDQWQTMRSGQWAGPPSPHTSLPRRALVDLCPWKAADPGWRALSDLLLRCVSSDPEARPESARLVQTRWTELIGEAPPA